MKRSFMTLSSLLVAVASAIAAGEVDYSTGIFIINEDWYGHQNSTVNYLQPDAPDGNYWQYRAFQTENPGSELGCTNQYGAIWNDRFYFIAKQEKDPGAKTFGGRITVADATTLKLVKQLQIIDLSGAQCDGRAFCGVSTTKGYVSSSNGIWILNLETLQIEGQVEGSANPNDGTGADKPNSDSSSSLYYGQTGTMILAEGLVFAVHQQYGLLVIDPAIDKVVQVLDMGIVDDAIEKATGERPLKPSGIGSTIVRSKDGNLWHSAAKNTQGSGVTVPYIVKVDPRTLSREVISIEGDNIYPPSNSWYAWTPDPFCASSVSNTLYWCGGENSWFTNYNVFKYDIDSGSVQKIVDFKTMDGNWQIYGCSLGVHPQTDDIYASVYHGFTDPTYETMRFDANGNLLKEYAMISNYWFPSMFVFPSLSDDENSSQDIINDEYIGIQVDCRDGNIIITGAISENVCVYTLSGHLVIERKMSSDGECKISNLDRGVYILKVGRFYTKILI